MGKPTAKDGVERIFRSWRFTSDVVERQIEASPVAVRVLAMAGTCVEHGVLLVSRCPHCGLEAGYGDRAVDRCSCGGLLAAPVGHPCTNEVDRLLLSMIDGRELFGLPPTTGLAQVSSHLLRLGLATFGWSRARPEVRGLEALRIRDLGLEVRRGGAPTLAVVLDRIIAAAPPARAGALGLTSGLGWVWSAWLGVPGANPLDAGLAREVRAFAATRGFAAARRGSGMMLGELRGLLGAGHERTRRIASSAGLLTGQEVRGVGMAIDEGAARALSERLGRLVDKSAARTLLGIGRGPFEGMVRAGLVAEDRGALTLGEAALFDPDLLIALVAATVGSAPVVARAPVGCVRLPDACRAEAVSMAVAVRAIMGGSVLPVAALEVDRDGLRGVFVMAADLRGLATPRPFGLRAAARQLGVHEDTARWLAAEGLIGEMPGAVERNHVAAFAKSYGTSAGVGAAFRIDGRRSAALLRAAKVAPAFGPPSCRQFLWRRSEATAALTALRLPR